MNTMEPGSGNSPKENSIQSKWIKKSIDPSYFTMIAVLVTMVFGFVAMVFGFWNMSARLDDIDARIDARFDAVNGRFDDVNARFDDIYARFDDVYGRFDAVNLRIDDLYGKFSQLQNQRARDNELLNEKFNELQNQRARDNEMLREELINQFGRLDRKIDETNDNFKEELMALSNKVEDLRVRVESSQSQNSASPDNESIVENETGEVKDLINKDSNNSKVSFSANQKHMSIGL